MCRKKRFPVTPGSAWKHVQGLNGLIKEAERKDNLHILIECEDAKDIIRHLEVYARRENQTTKPHKPKINQVLFTCPTCKNEVKKVTNQNEKAKTEYITESYCPFCGTLLTWEEAEQAITEVVRSYA